MYHYKFIRRLDLELSSLCNAECPLCLRNVFGHPTNAGYVERNLTLKEVKQIFKPEFIAQLHKINVCGNFGDIVMNPDTPAIMQYFRKHNPTANLIISTNGNARDLDFWKDLASVTDRIFFAIDGLEDTHKLYRRNTDFNTILENAQTVRNAGGKTSWVFMVFEHNQHQIEEARELSKQLGFDQFEVKDHRRDNGPVIDKNKNVIYWIGREFKIDVEHILTTKEFIDSSPSKYTQKIYNQKTIVCEAMKDRNIYVSSDGKVYPCCYIGNAPETYTGRAGDMIYRNGQIKQLVAKNDLFKYSLEECVEWFKSIPPTWKETIETGRLVACAEHCGQQCSGDQ